MQIEWNDLMKRFAYHRERTGLSNEDIKALVKEKYQTTFKRLSDEQLLDFGLYLKSLPDR